MEESAFQLRNIEEVNEEIRRGLADPLFSDYVGNFVEYLTATPKADGRYLKTYEETPEDCSCDDSSQSQLEEKASNDDKDSDEEGDLHSLFEDDKLLAQILSSSSLTVTDLKYCRLVCHRWNSTVVNILLDRNALTIKVVGHSVSVGFENEMTYYIHNIQKTKLKFLELLDIISQSPRFPCNSFHFDCASLNDPIVQQFITLFGSKIKSLQLARIEFDEDEEDDEFSYCVPDPADAYTDDDDDLFDSQFATLKHLLLNQASELQELMIDSIPKIWLTALKNDETFPDNLGILPKLKLLELPHETPFQIIQTFLEAAVNLEQVCVKGDVIGLGYFLFKDFSKLKLVKHLYFDPQQTNLNLYKLLKNKPLNLQQITVKTGRIFETPSDPVHLSILSQFLESNSKTLNSLCMPQLPDGFQLPKLPNLKQLELHEDQQEGLMGLGFRFLKTVNLSSKFPNLESVCITNKFAAGPKLNAGTLKYSSASTALITEDQVVAVPTVKYFEIIFDFALDSSFMNGLVRLFPNIVRAKIRGISNIVAETRDIWKFSKLQDLEVGYIGKNKVSGAQDDSLDSLFTGISSENCLMLQSQRDDGTTVQFVDAEKFREYPSVLDLKDLKKLEIRLHDKEDKQLSLADDCHSSTMDCSTLTWVSGMYGFSVCLGLNVNLLVDYVHEMPTSGQYWKDVLDSLGPYVSSDPW